MLKDDLQNCSFKFGLQFFGANKVRIDKADRRRTAENRECQRTAEGVAEWLFLTLEERRRAAT